MVHGTAVGRWAGDGGCLSTCPAMLLTPPFRHGARRRAGQGRHHRSRAASHCSVLAGAAGLWWSCVAACLPRGRVCGPVGACVLHRRLVLVNNDPPPWPCFGRAEEEGMGLMMTSCPQPPLIAHHPNNKDHIYTYKPGTRTCPSGPQQAAPAPRPPPRPASTQCIHGLCFGAGPALEGQPASDR